MLKEFNTESTTKLSNFNSQWTKTLYQNSLKNIAFFLKCFKALRVPCEQGWHLAVWAVVRKVASAGNRLNPSSNGNSALLESCVADQSCHNILFPQNSHHLTTDRTINFACKWRDEFHACTIENWTVVGRGYFSHTSLHSKNVASACRVPKEVLSHL